MLHESTNLTPSLKDKFLLYTGPINATAINEINSKGERKAKDQHAVIFQRNDKPDIDTWEEGTLKVYCPTVLPAFQKDGNLAKLNTILYKIEDFLYKDVPLLEAVRQGSFNDYSFFQDTLQRFIDENQGTSDLSQRALTENFACYDRSIQLQKIFLQENEEDDVDHKTITEQAILALARQKVVFIAMAPHYAIEAIFDDQYTDFPYHLPDFIHKEVTKNGPIGYYPNFDRSIYEKGMHHSLIGAPSPDMYRFNPILASLIAPYVMDNQKGFYNFKDWDNFQKKVIDHINDPITINAMQYFAKGMDIPVEFSFFAAYKMCQKDIRKRGFGHLYPEEEAKYQAQRIQDNFTNDLSYFQHKDPYLRISYYEENENGFRDGTDESITRERFVTYQKALRDRVAIEHVNSVIGTYKFVPWEKDDRNFSGFFLPYTVMKSEKTRMINVLCSDEFSPYWKEKGYWFKDCLPDLINSQPSMYSKWFIPLLEREMIDTKIVKKATQKAYEYLYQIH